MNYTNTGTTGDERTRTRAVNGTSFTFNGYTSTVPAGQTNIFSVGTSGNLSGQSLVWQQDNQNVVGANSSSVTLTFTRPVNNLTFQFQDIDSDVNFIDDLVFEPYINGSTTPATLTSANFATNANNEYVSGGRVRGKGGNVAAGNTAGDLTATMPAGVTKLVLYYNNSAAASAAGRLQTIGINSISWCAQADLFTQFITAPDNSVPGQSLTYTVQFGNNGPDVAASNVVRQVTVPAGATVTNAGGGTYSAINNTITWPTVTTLNSGSSTSFTYTYTAPLALSEYNNIATISAGTASSDPTENNTSTRKVLVTPASAPCTTAPVTFAFADRTTGEDWKARAQESVPSANGPTKIGTSNYTFNNTAGSLQIGTLNNQGVLVWTNDFSTTNGSNSIQFNFSRPVSNFSVEVNNINSQSGLLATDYTDQVVFAGSNGTSSVTPTLTSSGGVTIVGATATGNSTTNATVTASFPRAINTLTITFNNGNPALNNPDQQIIGIVGMTWCRLAPVANDVTNSATLPSTAGQVTLDPLSSSVDGTVQSYTITAIPASSQGILYYNATGSTYQPVSNGQVLTAAQAASLRFDPAAGNMGTSAQFTYTVKDDASLTSTTAATFTIPLQYVAPCTVTTTLNYSTRAAGEDWQNRTAEAVPTGSSVTQVSTTGYNPGANSANSFNTATLNGVQSLLWSVDYSANSTNSSSVTYTFSRLVSNFAVRIQDIDIGGGFIDRVIFTGSDGTIPVLPSLSKVNSNSAIVATSGNVATGTANTTSSVDGTVIAYFPSPIKSLTITYQNVGAGNDGASAGIGIDQMTWCRLDPAAKDITNASLPAGIGATAINNLSAAVDGTVQSYTITALPPSDQGTLYVNGAILNTTNFPGLVLTPTQATQLSFIPAVTYSGPVNFTYTVTDDQGQKDATPATYTIPVTATGASGIAAACAIPGKDGNAIGLTINPDAYYPSITAQTLAAGAKSIQVTAAAGAQTDITAGDLLLVIQMQGADIDNSNSDAYGDGVAGGAANGNLNNTNFIAGQYEYVVAANTVTAASGGTIQLVNGLKFGYQNAAATTTSGQRRFQVIRVPQYGNLTLGATITPSPWNGSTGGILVIDVAGQTSLNNFNLDVTGAGFRGGAGRVQSTVTGNDASYVTTTASDYNAQKGEGTAGTPRYVNTGTAVLDTNTDGYPNGGSASRGAPGNAGGGGNNNIDNSGGGGGANGGAGGRGGNNFFSNLAIGGEPGANFAAVNSNRLVLGGGGGAGSTNNGTGTPNNGFASSGKAGGGIVILRTGSITGTGSIIASGAAPNNTVVDDGGGGGGAGGSILVTATNPAGLINVTLTANGSDGGTNTGGSGGAHGPGGGGGGGVILANGTVKGTSVSSGANGTTTGGVAFGAAAGLVGVVNAQISSSIANSATGSVCASDVTTTLTGPATLDAGQPSGTYLATFTNNGPNSADGVTQRVTLPAGATFTSTQLSTIQTAYPGTTYEPSTRVLYFRGTTTTLAGGATNSFSFAFTAPTTTGSVPMSSTVATTSGQGVNAAPDQATLNLTVNAVSDVAATISGNGPVSAGGSGTFTVNFTDLSATGPQTANGVVATVQLPAGLGTVTFTGMTGSYNNTTGLVTYPSITSLTSGQLVTSTIAYTQPTTAAVVATASISTTSNEAGQTANNMATATNNTTAVYDVTTAISGPATITAGSQVLYNVSTTNSGTSSAAPNVTQTVTLPVGAANIFVTGGATYDATTRVVTFPAITSLAAGQTVNNTVSFTAPSSNYSVSARVASAPADTNTGNNTASVNTSVTAPPVTTTNANTFVTVTSSAASINAGSAITFNVTQGNAGKDPATDVVTRVAIPTGLPTAITDANVVKIGGAAPTSVSGTVATYANGAIYDASTGIVTFKSIASQSAGAANNNSYSITFTAPASGVVTATADVSATTLDNVAANNVATAQATVNSAATDVTTALSGPTSAMPGQRLTYTVTTTNTGLAPAGNVVQTVNIAAGLATSGTSAVTIGGSAPSSVNGDVATYPNGATYNASTGVVTFQALTSAAGGSSVTNSIAYTAPANNGASLVNIASVTTNSAETSLTNNTAMVTTTIMASADVQVRLTGPSTIVAGNPLTYAVTTTNNGGSVAASVTTTVQLPSGLTGVVVRDAAGNVLPNSTTSGYNSADGVVRFPAQSNQSVGNDAATSGTITLNAPASTNVLVPVATAMVTGTTDPNVSNNSASLATTVQPATTAQNDLTTILLANVVTQTAGQPVTFTVTTTNAATSTGTATGVVQTVQLPAGLTSNGGTVVVTGGGSYDNVTGLVTFPSTSIPNTGAAGAVTNTITVSKAPSIDPMVAIAAVRGNESDPTTSDNTTVVKIAITSSVDVATSITGPATTVAGNTVNYSVVTRNNSASPATNVTQTVTLPAGVTSYSLNGGAPITVASGATITILVPSTLNPGDVNTVTNTISFTAPSTSFAVVSNVRATGDNGTTGNNTATQNTATTSNRAPVAANLINTLQSPEGNTAGPLLLSSLSATDADGNTDIKTYTIATLPSNTQGILYNGTTALAPGATVTLADIAKLTFDPAAGYVGNASFTYTATDAAGATSLPATYLIPVGQDVNSVYTNTTPKGGNNPYQDSDIISNAFDANGGTYNAASPQAITDNGVRSAALASGSNALPAGVTINSTTGVLTVSNRALLKSGTYTVTITTVDANGGTNTQPVTFTIGSLPLPVELTAFTATAKGNDAVLAWSTASEKANDHFEVERSLDGITFVAAGTVKGQGTSTTAHEYSLLDARAARLGQKIYYRLKQVDTDGTVAYSPVRTVAFVTEPAQVNVSLYPNPTTAEAHLDLSTLPTGTYTVSLVDLSGRTIATQVVDGGLVHVLHVQHLPSGAYLILINGKDTHITKRLLKQ
ncbi:T9SS type A sorting domain-containing protein [Hymenobacter sp. GOD-10R]|uniref:T9SS type A sorting domain-containing protein n=1 Tax=Hymenobacter sp. GOD-10R TaxID=3093922 RepID=UPI002D7A2942|nr:T9SS type A sorting domain-containing protein [Hymenobacter sp. GOD-10R]WRQ29359.1 T9SS type A sorting domain-containing protein [Hymenobacter sp. GOD-10R]